MRTLPASSELVVPTHRRAAMRAVRLDGPGLPPAVVNVAMPRPRADEVLLRVLAAGVCHTELQLLDGTLNPGVWPLTPGHEIVGEVVEGPPELLGQRALVYYSRPCGECDWCASGHEQVCPNAGPQPGLSTDGGFADFARVPAASLVELPDGLDAVEAAPLGCAAATGYHALHAVAGVQPGETLVVYGIGGVGLALVQLGALLGARVLAIGRSPTKLGLAREYGAEVIDGSSGDPALEVRRLTRGEGAHAVFELVASEQTLPSALAMLRRRGRLVLVGYGRARLRLNPLELVLREVQLLSALGNTRAELKEVVRLAAAGALRIPVGAEFGLDEVDTALDRLRRGEIAGRAVIVPGLAGRPALAARPTEVASAVASDGLTSAAVADLRPHGRPSMANDAVADQRRHGASNVASDAVAGAPNADDAALTSAAGQSPFPLEAELLEFVSRGIDTPRDDAEFNTLALRLFAYQFSNNHPYRQVCERRHQTPSTVSHWRAIPPVPIAAFKETLLVAEPIEHAVEFNSSGTTQPERKSRHFHPSLRLYDRNAELNFKAHVLPDHDRMPMLVLFPPRHELPHSSLAHWLTLMVERFGTHDSTWLVSNAGGLDAPRAVAALRQTQAPVALLAPSFGLVHLLEYCQDNAIRLVLPPGSRVMDTGGYKGRSREYARDDLYAMASGILGVRPTHMVNMYGMTEHGTQFLDAALRDHVTRGTPTADRRYKVVPPWARTLVVHPETLAEQPPGERGLLLHFDLINRASALAVLSEDVGYTRSDGFEVIGRAEGSEARGCSIALDELIEAVRGARR